MAENIEIVDRQQKYVRLMEEHFALAGALYEAEYLLNMYHSADRDNMSEEAESEKSSLSSLLSFLSSPYALRSLRYGNEDDKSYDANFLKKKISEKWDTRPESGFVSYLSDYAPDDRSSSFYRLLFGLIQLYVCASDPDYEIIPANIRLRTSSSHAARDIDFLLDTLTSFLFPRDRDESDASSVSSLEGVNSVKTAERLRRRAASLLRVNQEEDISLPFFQLKTLVYYFILRLVDDSLFPSAANRYAIAQAAFGLARYARREKQFSMGVDFGKLSLLVHSPTDRMRAYNNLGRCALEASNFQLAYDTYLSWISQKACKSICTQTSLSISRYMRYLNQALQSDEEHSYRQDRDMDESIMFNNFANICRNMAQLQEATPSHQALSCIVEFFYSKSVEETPSVPVCHMNLGLYYSSENRLDDALEQFASYLRLEQKAGTKLWAHIEILRAYEKKLYLSGDLTSEEWSDYIQQWDNLRRSLAIMPPLEEADQADQLTIRYAMKLDAYLKTFESVSAKDRTCLSLLLRIRQAAGEIRKKLRRNTYLSYHFDLHLEMLKDVMGERLPQIEEEREDEKQTSVPTNIAYYAALGRLDHLFEEIDPATGKKADDHITGQNRLTVMHERYMNDPEEGLVLLKHMRQWLPLPPEELRARGLDKKHVFLKSFTEQVDTLNMWTLYGTDESSGHDCTGCCVCLAPETFEFLVNTLEGRNAHSRDNPADDYHLFHVAYLHGDEVWIGNRKNDDLTDLFAQLKEYLRNLHEAVSGLDDVDPDTVADAIIQSLGSLIFLFKESTYSQEAETRLILTREFGAPDIRHTEGKPSLLYLNPPFQVYVEKIILGPKLKDADKWIPYLQEQLQHMSAKWPESMRRQLEPTVRNSKIRIRD